jgi:hypothetical protein
MQEKEGLKEEMQGGNAANEGREKGRKEGRGGNLGREYLGSHW